MQKLQLELILARADKSALEDDYSDHSYAVEFAIEPSSAVEAVKQDGGIFFCFARWPAGDIVVLRSEHQSSVLKMINAVYHFASVDIPDLLDFFAEQFPTGYHRLSPSHAQLLPLKPLRKPLLRQVFGARILTSTVRAGPS